MDKMNNIAVLQLGNLNIEILDLYNLSLSSTFTSTAHTHFFMEIHFILEGSARLNINKETYCVHKNSLIIIPKNSVHFTESISQDFQSFAFSFHLKYNGTPPIINAYEYGYFSALFDLKSVCTLDFGDYDRMIMQNILNNINVFSVYAINKINTESTNLFLEISKKLSAWKQMPANEVYTSIYERDTLRNYKIECFMQRNLSQQVTIQDLANFLALSTRQTSRYLNETLGVSFKDLLTKYRMILADNLIEQNRLPLYKIAAEVGYTTYNGFLAAYKKYHKHERL